MIEKWVVTLPPLGAARMVASHVVNALSKQVGQDNCKVFDTRQYMQAISQLQKTPDETFTIDLLNQTLAINCLDFDANYLLVPALSPVTVFVLNLLRKQGLKTVHWFYEDFRKVDHWSLVLPGYDLFCAIQRGPILDACKAANTRYCFLPTAVTIPEIKDNAVERQYDVAFIGVPSPYRIAILEALMDSGIALAIAGAEWDTYSGKLEKALFSREWTSEEQTLRLLASAKIGINLSIDEPGNDEHVHISPRVFDIIASGCVLVTEDVPLLKDNISNSTAFTFKKDEAIRCIHAVLENYHIMLPITKASMDAVRTEHTFSKRLELIRSLIKR